MSVFTIIMSKRKASKEFQVSKKQRKKAKPVLNRAIYPFAKCCTNECCEGGCLSDIMQMKTLKYNDDSVFVSLLRKMNQKKHSFNAPRYNPDPTFEKFLKDLRIKDASDITEMFKKRTITTNSKLNDCVCCSELKGIKILEVRILNVSGLFEKHFECRLLNSSYKMYLTYKEMRFYNAKKVYPYKILGLGPEASREEITLTHERLKKNLLLSNLDQGEEEHLNNAYRIAMSNELAKIEKGESYFLSLDTKAYSNLLEECLYNYVYDRKCNYYVPHFMSLLHVENLDLEKEKVKEKRDRLSPIGHISGTWIISPNDCFYVPEDSCGYEKGIGIWPRKKQSKHLRENDIRNFKRFVKTNLREYHEDIVVSEKSELFQSFLKQKDYFGFMHF